MARYKPVDRSARLLPVVLSEQLLPGNASKERSGTHAELLHRAQRLDQAAAKILAAHRQHDRRGEEDEAPHQRAARVQAIEREAQRTRDFVAATALRTNRQG